MEGQNDFGRTGYGGPCPPRGPGPHRYFFRLHALDDELDLPAGSSLEKLEPALRAHSLGSAELVGTYQRS